MRTSFCTFFVVYDPIENLFHFKKIFFTCERVEEAGWTNHHQIHSVCMHVKELKTKRDAVIECPWSLSTIAKHAGKTQKEGSC